MAHKTQPGPIISALALALTLTLAACGFGSSARDTLTYSGATEQTVAMGESVPGSDIRYVGYSEAGAEVLIADQRAVKKPGDSLDWKGTPAAGVDAVLTQRIVAANASRLQTVGTIQVTVHDVTAVQATFPDQPAYRYKVATTYNIKKGEKIPGTLISYAGKTEQGAELAGVSGYPYRKLGDSIGWAGRLRSNVYLDTTLRVIAYTDSFLQVGGLAEIGVIK